LLLLSGFIEVLIPLSWRYLKHSSEPYLLSAAIHEGVPIIFSWDSISLGIAHVSCSELSEAATAVIIPFVSVAIWALYERKLPAPSL